MKQKRGVYIAAVAATLVLGFLLGYFYLNMTSQPIKATETDDVATFEVNLRVDTSPLTFSVDGSDILLAVKGDTGTILVNDLQFSYSGNDFIIEDFEGELKVEDNTLYTVGTASSLVVGNTSVKKESIDLQITGVEFRQFKVKDVQINGLELETSGRFDVLNRGYFDIDDEIVSLTNFNGDVEYLGNSLRISGAVRKAKIEGEPIISFY